MITGGRAGWTGAGHRRRTASSLPSQPRSKTWLSLHLDVFMYCMYVFMYVFVVM